jgi:hypothetical protein
MIATGLVGLLQMNKHDLLMLLYQPTDLLHNIRDFSQFDLFVMSDYTYTYAYTLPKVDRRSDLVLIRG